MKLSNLLLLLVTLCIRNLPAQTLQVDLSSAPKVNRSTTGGTATIFFDSSIEDLSIICTEENPNEPIVKINDHQWFVNIDVNKDIDTDGICYRNYVLKCSASAEYYLTVDEITPNQVFYYTITLPNELEPKLLEARAKGAIDIVNRLIENGDSYTAKLVALSVLPKDLSNQTDYPYTIDGERALRMSIRYNSAIIPYSEDYNNSFGVWEKSVVFSPNDSLIAYTVNNDIKVLEAMSGCECFSLKGHTGRVYKALFSNNGDLLLSMSWDCTVRIWDVKRRQEIQKLKVGNNRGSIPKAFFSPNGKQVVTCGWDEFVRIWDVNKGLVLDSLKTSIYCSAVSYSADGKYIIANVGEWIYLWDIQAKQLIKKIKGGDYGTSTLNKEGTLLVSTDYHGHITLWNVETGKLIHKIDQEGSLYSVQFSPDGKEIISSSSYGKVNIWSVKTGKLIKEFNKHRGAVTYASFSNDKKRVVSISEDRTIRIWDNILPEDVKVLKGHKNIVSSISFSPNGYYLASGSYDETICIWDVKSGKMVSKLASKTSRKNRISSISYNQDGNNIVSASLEVETIIWNVHNKTIIGDNYGGREGDYSATYSSDGKYIIMGTPLRILNVEDLSVHCYINIPEVEVYSISCSPNGKEFLTASGDGLIRVWDMQNGTLLNVLRGHTLSVHSAAYSPDGNYIASASADSTIRIWNAQNGTEIKKLLGHKGDVYSVAFSPDGKRIVSGSLDETVRIWDVEKGINVGTLEGHNRAVTSVVYSKDGRSIASGSCDETIRLWDRLSLQDLINLTNERFRNRKLTMEEKAELGL